LQLNCNESRQPHMSSNRISSPPPHSCFIPSFPVTPNVHVWLSALTFRSYSMVVIWMWGGSAWNGERLMFYGSSFLCSSCMFVSLASCHYSCPVCLHSHLLSCVAFGWRFVACTCDGGGVDNRIHHSHKTYHLSL